MLALNAYKKLAENILFFLKFYFIQKQTINEKKNMMKLIFLLISISMSLSFVLGQRCLDTGEGIGKGFCPDLKRNFWWGYVEDSGNCIGGCCK